MKRYDELDEIIEMGYQSEKETPTPDWSPLIILAIFAILLIVAWICAKYWGVV